MALSCLAMLLRLSSLVILAEASKQAVYHHHALKSAHLAAQDVDQAFPPHRSLQHFELHSVQRSAIRTRRGQSLDALEAHERLALTLYTHGRFDLPLTLLDAQPRLGALLPLASFRLLSIDLSYG